MSDFADLAANREQQLRDDALADHARRTRQREDSALYCAVCAEPIPDARRQAVPGVQTCLDCQRELEQAVRLF